MKSGQFIKLNLAFLAVSTFFTWVAAIPASTNVVVPFSAVGDIAAIQATAGTGDTRLYAQNAAGEILQTCVTNAFTNSSTHTTCGSNDDDVIVPANQTLYGTPIAAAVLQAPGGFGVIHLYFVSPDNVLSEYIYEAAAGGLRGGPTCSDCITTQGFRVVEGSQAMYAVGSVTTSRQLRVGFISQGAPDTISEAIYDGSRWQIAGLPN